MIKIKHLIFIPYISKYTFFAPLFTSKIPSNSAPMISQTHSSGVQGINDRCILFQIETWRQQSLITHNIPFFELQTFVLKMKKILQMKYGKEYSVSFLPSMSLWQVNYKLLTWYTLLPGIVLMNHFVYHVINSPKRQVILSLLYL